MVLKFNEKTFCLDFMYWVDYKSQANFKHSSVQKHFDWWNNRIRMIFFILLQTIICVESQYIKDSSEKEMIDLVTNLVKDQNCAIQLVSETFDKGSTALSLIENLQEAMVPASISTTLQDIRGNKHCHLNVVITKSNQFVNSLDFNQKVKNIC